MNRKAVGLSLAVAAVALVPAALYAQARPHDVNARKFLRTAQLLMRVPERPNVQLTLKKADDEVDAAIKEIDGAVAIDRRDKADGPPPDARVEAKDRLREIVELLHAARTELQQGQTGPQENPWRSRVSKHVDDALDAVHHAAIDAHLDREIGSF